MDTPSVRPLSPAQRRHSERQSPISPRLSKARLLAYFCKVLEATSASSNGIAGGRLAVRSTRIEHWHSRCARPRKARLRAHASVESSSRTIEIRVEHFAASIQALERAPPSCSAPEERRRLVPVGSVDLTKDSGVDRGQQARGGELHGAVPEPAWPGGGGRDPPPRFREPAGVRENGCHRLRKPRGDRSPPAAINARVVDWTSAATDRMTRRSARRSHQEIERTAIGVDREADLVLCAEHAIHVSTHYLALLPTGPIHSGR